MNDPLEFQVSFQDETDDLSSEKGIDYTRLRDLLKAQQWEEAEEETYYVVNRARGKDMGGGIMGEGLSDFPCKDLKTIDSLWVKYSSGHFGFSIQKQIYVECGAKLDGNYPGDEIWKKFIDRIGWQRQNIKTLKFSTSLSPTGELPCFFLLWRCAVDGRVSGGCQGFLLLFSRIETCEL